MSSETSFLIRNSLVCDGSGSAPFPADILIENGIIREVGKVSHPAAKTLDAAGLLLTPGFIDVHAHSDLSLFASPEAFGKISQGVTTEISGNCGLSAFPVMTPLVREHLEKLYAIYNEKITWNDFSSWKETLEKRIPAVNVMSLCGYNTLRANVYAYEDRPVSENGVKRMRELLRTMLLQGAAGLSTGLLYVPGKFAKKEELSSVASVLKEFDLPHATHLRSEGQFLLESAEEALAISRAGAGRLQISHLKTAKKENFHKLPELLAMLERARESGMKVTADRYPYTFSQTSLSVILPPPYDAMPDAAIQKALSESPEECVRLEKLLREKDFARVILCSSHLPWAKALAGLTVPEAAEKTTLPPSELVIRILKEDSIGAMAAFGGLSEENLSTILSQDFVCCGTDETARPEEESIGRSHPRGFGSFPEFFRRVSSLQGIPEAVRRMTSLPASIFRIGGRGLVKPGFAADLVLFDPGKFVSNADFVHPHARASGIAGVWVNGILSYDGTRVLTRAGRVTGPAI